MKTMRFFSMVALALMGAIMTSCSSDDTIADNPQQPTITDNVVTLTTTIGLEGEVAATRALTPTGVKTFAKDDRIAVIYENTSGTMVRAVSEKLTDEDIIEGGKSATFTVTLTNPKTNGGLKYIYPEAMSTDGGDINYSALNNQNGTLDNISSYYDLGFYEGTFNGSTLPSVTLENKLTILALTLKGNISSTDITSSITGLTLSDGTYSYNITRSASAGPIYVAMRPTSSATIDVTATYGTKYYVKTLTGKTYEANKGYNLSWIMAEVIKGKFTVNSNGKQVYFSKGNLQATTTDLGNHWTWKFAEHQWDKIGGRTKNNQNVESGEYTCNNYITGTNKPTVSANGTVDLFGWSTSTTYLGISSYNDNANYSGDFVDWGSHADVIASIGTGWRTLSDTKSGGAVGEWDYILNRRSTTSDIRYAKAQVNNVFGLIILPDDWSTSYYTLNYTNENGSEVGFASCNNITLKDWNDKLEAHGAVFLPVAGQRRTDNHFVDYPNGRLYYWSSTLHDAGTAYRMYFAGNEYSYSVNSGRRFGYSVRLVRDVK